MNPERLLALFDRISEAPDAVPRLRRFVLDLAVRGKLVEQDPNDEPADRLLEAIRQERVRVAGKGRRTRDQRVSPMDEATVPFVLPEGWRWVRLTDALRRLTDGTHHSPPNSPVGEYKYITAKNIKDGGISLDEITYVSADTHREIYARCDPEKGDLLYIKDGATTGVVTINDLDEPFSMLSSVALLKPCAGVSNRLLVQFLRSPFFYDQMRGFMKGAAITRVTLARMAPALLPLPPREEQLRIVAKLDELTVLCDQLEAAQAERERRRDRVAVASLHRLDQPAADASEFRAHAEFHLHNLPRLVTRPEHVQQLRQTILNLAVRGRLVAQDLKDEPLSRMDLDSREKPDSESVEPIPETWQWFHIGDLLLGDSQNGYSRRPDDAADGVPILRISAGTARADGIVAEEEYKLIGRVSAAERSQYEVLAGDLLACRFNGNRRFVGRLALYRGYLNLSQIYPDKLIRLRVRPDIAVSELLRYFGESDLVRKSIDAFTATTVGNWGISASNLKRVRIPIPPLTEQHRILAKVDELMGLCDQLEAQLTAHKTDGSSLLEAVLHEALAPA